LDLDVQLRTLALSLGADYFGIADLSSAHDFILGQGGELVAWYPRAIAIGIGTTGR
jgi:epoxyqueuosine reductase